MMSKFSSASSKIIAHSAGVKLAFRGHFAGKGVTFSAMLIVANCWHAQTKISHKPVHHWQLFG